ncbi:hypothetical protein EVAR_41054_1 [Eumeta japonica]|uniref:Uncharacterized protein n=1 Tax=Eumeta variegata TaxID=151549 RepID=A0A4C1XVI7_EUMVA|nr:hypothetical protein EVAR_41054_1 [Eumeta japonica]
MSESTLADAIVLAIKTASKETSKIVNELSKLWQICRVSVKIGEARETCEALIYTETDPLQIMRVLERRFERPDAIIKQELNKLRRMMPMNGGMGNISSFANKDSQNSDEPELVMLSTLLNKIADQCSASMPIEKSGSRNLRPTPERRPRRTNTINT